jgi:anti-sigma factor RsiW
VSRDKPMSPGCVLTACHAEEYLDGTLDDGLRLSVNRHLNRCPHCRARMGMMRKIGDAHERPERDVEDGA